MKYYAISDIHGNVKALDEALTLIDLNNPDNKLILLGDYVHGRDSVAVIDKVMALEEKYGKDRVVVLRGNHEELVLEGESLFLHDTVVRKIPNADLRKYKKWMKQLRLFYRTKDQIFVHAGLNEGDGEEMIDEGRTVDDYLLGTPDDWFTNMYPPNTGKFVTDVIAGHTGTHKISGNPDFHDIYYDGESHFYIDGSVQYSGVIPVLMFDTDTKEYYSLSRDGRRLLIKR
ncbi:serine/threonine protein phosphatase 1 [Pseudobutyrivibrio sp. ACV-2]|uniref:metallophosphoesterase n=1 Tax=Pseudobutyrivibrio sp. ACV-2 TaxID=1520801 RepID=UPI00089CCE54|nr:metallophosphoesterase [Pseudobutyrivibrio sp. ACV-2]SEA70295.1 serine/threonine protein phosphatase 1 [Pseudobutyrivibrio sp. ACV-2]